MSKVVMSAVHGRYGISNEKIESQPVIRIIHE